MKNHRIAGLAVKFARDFKGTKINLPSWVKKIEMTVEIYFRVWNRVVGIEEKLTSH